MSGDVSLIRLAARCLGQLYATNLGMLRSRGSLGWVGAVLLWVSVSCASKFTDIDAPSESGLSGVGGSAGSSTPRGGSGADTGATGGTGGQSLGGSAGSEIAGSAGVPVANSGGAAPSGGTGGIGGSVGTAGEAGETVSGSGGSAGSAPRDPIARGGLVYWFSADSGVTETNGGVSKWLDRSGNGNDAAQISGDSRPRLRTFADTGLPALVFDGDNDYLALAPLRTTFDGGLTFFAVARPTDAAYCMPLLELSNGEEIDDVSLGWTTGALSYEVFSSFVSGQDDAFTLGEPRLVDVTHATTGDVNLWMNGLANGISTFDLPAAVTRQQAFIGKSLYHACSTWNGEIGELILYARALETSERQSVESYLEAKWGCCGN